MNAIYRKSRYKNSQIVVGAGLYELASYLPKKKVYIITDSNVRQYYGNYFPDFPVFTFQAGEAAKTIETVYRICGWLLEKGAARDAFLLGIGGGVVSDITGFVASIYMRGISFGFVATSLMAQADASIGGKNGVNLNSIKNIIGTFNQPHFVLIDPAMLKTIPFTEVQNGLAEVVKHSLIADRQMFYKMSEESDKILKLQEDIIHELIQKSVKIKLDIVRRDEFEDGERRKLNLGHTWGHAIEKTDSIPHGQAVSIGLVFAARLSERKGMLTSTEVKQITNLLHSFGLPTETTTDPQSILDAVLKDKKSEAGQIHFVLMDGIGNAKIELIKFQELLL